MILLDTHVWVNWVVKGDSSLSPAVVNAIQQADCLDHPVYRREDQAQMLENITHRLERTMSSALGLHTVLNHIRHVSV